MYFSRACIIHEFRVFFFNREIFMSRKSLLGKTRTIHVIQNIYTSYYLNEISSWSRDILRCQIYLNLSLSRVWHERVFVSVVCVWWIGYRTIDCNVKDEKYMPSFAVVSSVYEDAIFTKVLDAKDSTIESSKAFFSLQTGPQQFAVYVTF